MPALTFLFLDMISGVGSGASWHILVESWGLWGWSWRLQEANIAKTLVVLLKSKGARGGARNPRHVES